jgi:hypothetical protein
VGTAVDQIRQLRCGLVYVFEVVEDEEIAGRPDPFGHDVDRVLRRHRSQVHRREHGRYDELSRVDAGQVYELDFEPGPCQAVSDRLGKSCLAQATTSNKRHKTTVHEEASHLVRLVLTSDQSSGGW